MCKHFCCVSACIFSHRHTSYYPTSEVTDHSSFTVSMQCTGVCELFNHSECCIFIVCHCGKLSLPPKPQNGRAGQSSCLWMPVQEGRWCIRLAPSRSCHVNCSYVLVRVFRQWQKGFNIYQLCWAAWTEASGTIPLNRGEWNWGDRTKGSAGEESRAINQLPLINRLIGTLLH